MSGVIIRLEPAQAERGLARLGGILCSVDESPFPGIARKTGRLRVIAAKRSSGGVAPVEKEGKRLAEWMRRDDAIRSVIDQVRLKGGPPSVPIHLLVLDKDAHTLAWETLFVEGFLALNELSPIARIPRNLRTDVRDPVRPLALPLRVTCVMSATGVSALKQWTAVHDSVSAVRDRVPVQLTIISGDKDVLQAAKEKAAADPLLVVHPVPGPNAPVPLLELIRRTEPHVLHFFAHGDVDRNSAQRILVATVSDVDTDSGILDADEVGRMAAQVGTWCVVLTICGGADAATTAQLTHAETIVTHGVPASIAMRTEITSADADRFTQSWFPVALDALAAVAVPAAQATERRPLQWADTLTRARRDLRDRNGADAGANGVWSLPVLYAVPGTFLLEVPGGAHGVIAETVQQDRLGSQDTIEQLIAILVQRGAPPEAIAQLRERLAQDGPVA
ncbi:CHAT domain-containing protein [Microbacterium sp. SS28]|uniref:CHAT domain-containing protein n=1 Tax=Microbacterium sp. SS28 TaxID=2919948 RepID=UPI001FAAAD8C|nr:CHAT domain-containing protein [Microbacterium sp. SS28]